VKRIAMCGETSCLPPHIPLSLFPSPLRSPAPPTSTSPPYPAFFFSSYAVPSLAVPLTPVARPDESSNRLFKCTPGTTQVLLYLQAGMRPCMPC